MSLNDDVMLALDTSCLHQEIQSPWYFLWMAQPEHLEMCEIGVRQSLRSLAPPPTRARGISSARSLGSLEGAARFIYVWHRAGMIGGAI